MRFSTLAIWTAAAATAHAQDPYTAGGGDVTSAQTTYITTRTVYRVDQTVTATYSHAWESWSSTADSSWATSTASSSAPWPSNYNNGTTTPVSASSGSLPTTSSTVPVNGASSIGMDVLPLAVAAGILGYVFM